MNPLLLIFFCAWLPAENALWAADSWIWWEGEKPSSSNIPASTWLSPSSQSERDVLSGGNIRTAVDIITKGPYRATYSVNVTQTGTYRLYARKIWQYGVFKWHFDSADWTFAGSQLQLIDSADYKQFFPLNWVYLGDVTLAAGAHTFSVEMNAADWPNEPESNKNFGGFDAFILSTQPFIPRGKLKPGEKYALAEPGKWNFEAPADDFSPTALLDLRSLNERVAGQSGFVRVAADQSGKYVLGDGKPVRFWGVNVGNMASDLASFSQQARFLAKRGVNLVRYHQSLPTSDPRNINAVDSAYIEGAHRAVAAFKQEGIYMEFSLFYQLVFTIRKEWGIDGYTADKTAPPAILMFDEKLKAAYKEWARQLFATTNAYTGLTLAQDPSVAIIEVQNEDSFFWWSFDPTTFPRAQREKLEAKFGTFLTAKYGTLGAAQLAWGPVPLSTDAPANGRMGLAIPWYMTAASTEPWFLTWTPRMADQIQFLTELQRAFYQEMRDYYRGTLGCQSLLESCNWTTADERILTDAERYTYTVNDVVDRHPYFSPVHVDPNPPDTGTYAVSVGDYYQSVAGVKNPRSLPTAYKKVEGFPHNASETTWVNPNRFKAEGPMLVAAYSSMAAIDGWIWFATSALGYEDSVNKFQVSVPSLMGQFPGAALLYRRGDVSEAPVAVREERNLSRLYHKELALISELDPSRNPPDNPVYDSKTGTGRIDPLAMLVGKVECHYGTDNAASYVSPLLFSQLDMVNRTVESLPVQGNTRGQLNLDWGKGLFRVNTSRSQGAAGFLNSVAQVDLDDVSITSSNEFGAILVIALDNLPIAQSQKILIQAMTEDNPYHWKEQDQVFTNNNVVYTGKKIVSMGQAPMNVVNIMGAVTLKGLGQGRGATVRVLDENGYYRGNGNSQVLGPDLKITLPENSLYTVVMMPPSITSQPQSQTVMIGGAANFSVIATGMETLSYQWQFNGDPVSGATNSTFSVGDALVAQAGTYLVVVTNPGGATASKAAVLTVNAPTAITAQPQSQTLVSGTEAILNVTATGTPPLSYQWQLNGRDLTDDGRFNGTQSDRLFITEVSASDAGNYRVVVTNSYGRATSNEAVLTVLRARPVVTWANPAAIIYGTALSADQLNASAIVPGEFAYSPASGISLGAGTTTLSALFTPDDSANYDSVTVSANIVVLPARLSVIGDNDTRLYGAADPVFKGSLLGLINGDAITASYSTPATPSSQVGTYPIVPALTDVNNRLGNYAVIAKNGTLTVTPAPLTATTADTTRVYGEANPVFQGTITGLLNGDNITPAYECAAMPASPPGTYAIVPSLVDPDNRQANYQVLLIDGTLTVTPAAPPTIDSITPEAGPTQGGTTMTILGTGFQNGATVNFGALAASLVNVVNSTNLTAMTPPSGPGKVNVVVTNADGQSTTVTNGFTYAAPSGIPPSIVSQLANQFVGLGQMAAFSVTVTGTVPIGYQWQVNGGILTDNDRITGSQSNLLAIADVVISDAGNYQVVVTNAYGSVTSPVAMLTTVLPPVFQAVTQANGAITLTWSATAGQRYQVQYKTELSQPDWTNLVIVTAANSIAIVSDSLNSSAQHFYRTVWLP